MKTMLFAAIVLASQALSAAPKPDTLTIIFPIEGNRSTRSSAVAISSDYILTCSHAIRDDHCNVGEVVEVNEKYDWAIILADDDKKNKTWSELRDTPLKVGEIVYFNGGTARVRKDGFLDVLSGQIIHGMSGGPIWDKDGKVFSVISEYYIEAKILYGYYAVDWVREELGEGLTTCSPKPEPKVSSDRLNKAIEVRNRLQALVENKGLPGIASGGLADALGTAPETPYPADPPEAVTEAPTAGKGDSESSLPLPVQSDTTVPTLRDKIQAYASRGGVAYYESNGRRKTSLQHMSNVHGWSMSELRGLSQREIDLLHGMSHTKKIKPASKQAAVQHDAVPEAVAAVPQKAQPQTGKGYWKKVCHGTWCELVWVPTN